MNSIGQILLILLKRKFDKENLLIDISLNMIEEIKNPDKTKNKSTPIYPDFNI